MANFKKKMILNTISSLNIGFRNRTKTHESTLLSKPETNRVVVCSNIGGTGLTNWARARMKEPGNANLVEPQIGRGLIGSSLFTSTMPIKFLLAAPGAWSDATPAAAATAQSFTSTIACLLWLLLCDLNQRRPKEDRRRKLNGSTRPSRSHKLVEEESSYIHVICLFLKLTGDGKEHQGRHGWQGPPRPEPCL